MSRRFGVLSAAFAFGLGLALAAPSRAMAADTYKVDTVHSSVVFRVKHNDVSYAYGRFNNISGTFSFDDQKPENSSFDLKVMTDSIDTASAPRDGHLKSATFFNATQFPNVTFKSKKVAKDGKDSYKVTGDLTLHGVTKPVSLTVDKTGSAKNPRGGYLAGFESTFTINRTDFNMKNMVGPIGDEVKLTVSVEGNRP